MKLVSLSFHIKDIGVEGLSRLNHLFLPHAPSLSVISNSETQSKTHSETQIPVAQKISAKLEAFRTQAGASEMFYLATCNRFELVMSFEREVPESFNVGTDLIPRAFLGKKTVIDHLLGVALSRDSVVFGESQIMGQIKTAFNEQREGAGYVGPTLTRVLNLILREAKAIRTDMGLSNHHTSVASVAARSVLQFFRNTEAAGSGRRMLMIGAGESNQTFSRYLSKRELREFFWLNRTQARAEVMATEIGGSALNWNAFDRLLVSEVDGTLSAEHAQILPEADVICCATDADRMLVTAEVLRQVKPRIVVDISMPSNTDRDLVLKHGVQYLGLDDINSAVKLERARYEEILREMNMHIEESVARLMGELMVHQAGHVLKDSVSRSEELLSQVWEEQLPSELQGLSEDQIQALQRWSQKLVKRLTHTHLETLKVVLKKPNE